MPTIFYLDKFYDDLLKIWHEIAQDNPSAADKMLDKIRNRALILEDHPKAGQSRPDIHPECRHLPEGRYVILYRIVENGVEIRCVYWAGRNITADMF